MLLFNLHGASNPAFAITTALNWVALIGMCWSATQRAFKALWAYLGISLFTIPALLLSPTFENNGINLRVNLAIGLAAIVVMVGSFTWMALLFTSKGKGRRLRWTEATANLFIGGAALTTAIEVLVWTPWDFYDHPWLSNYHVQYWAGVLYYHGLLYVLPYLLAAILVVAAGELGHAGYAWFRQRRTRAID